MILVRARGVGSIIDQQWATARAFEPRYTALPSGYVPDPGTTKAIAAAQAPVEALRPDCTTGCSADAGIAADPDAMSRCVSICTSTRDLELAKRQASRGAFCRQVIEAVSPSLGPALRGDYQVLFEQCQTDPDAFLARLREQGIDLGVSFEPWLKRNWKTVAIGGAALVGLLIVRRLRR